MFHTRQIHHEKGQYRVVVEITAGPNRGRQFHIAYNPLAPEFCLEHGSVETRVLIGVEGETFEELMRTVQQAVGEQKG